MNRVIDLNKVRFMRSSGRDLLILERLAGGELDVRLHRLGGLQGLFVPAKYRGSVEDRSKLFKDLLASGLTEIELIEGLADSMARSGGTMAEAALHFHTSSSIYRSSSVQQTLKDWGLDPT